MAQTETAQKEKEAVQPELVEEPKAAPKELEKFSIPPVITKSEEYDRVYRYLMSKYHVLTPVTAFSGMAPQHGLVVARVLIDSDPTHGEVYQDKLFCKTGNKDPLDDEVAIAKVGLRKLALAGGWNLSADVLVADKNYWVVRGNNRFLGLDGSVQSFAATEEYDLREGSPQVRNMSEAQRNAARAHGLRGGEARALNAACREYGIKQKYTRRELQKAFVVMRMMFIPDASNEMQMRIVTERALQGTTAMFPQASATQALEPIEGMKSPIDPAFLVVEQPPQPVAQSQPVAQEPVVAGIPNMPAGYVLLKKVAVEKKQNRAKTSTFDKWTATDHNGATYVTIKKEFGAALMSCWNQQEWQKGRPVELTAATNDYRENEISEINPLPLSPMPEDESQDTV